MKRNLFFFILLVLVSSTLIGETAEQYIDLANNYVEENNLEQAINTLKQAVEEYPDNADIYAFLGLYLGQWAGQATNFQEKASSAFESFNMLDRAVSLDSLNLNARYYRGIIGVNVPEFMGKLGQAIEDLKIVIDIYSTTPDEVTEEMLITTYSYLGLGYEKNNNNEAAISAYESIIELFPGTESVVSARKSIESLTLLIEEDNEIISDSIEDNYNLDELMALAQEYYDSEDYEKAEELLLRALKSDSLNSEIYKLLGMTYLYRAEVEYNEIISEDTDYRSNLCFKAMDYYDKAVSLDPENVELRLFRGAMGVNFPFFVGKLDQAIEDLNFVLDNSNDDEQQATALYYFGVAYKKKALTPWIKVVTDYPESEYASLILETEQPYVNLSDNFEHDKPFAVIDFSLGFQDELPPQTAVWVEDEDGNFIRTIYVSGFAGFVDNVQVTLPVWGNSSNFNTDANTSASIDIGYHSYIWDITNTSGNSVVNGLYIIKVEVSHWPSMLYQLVSTEIEIGDGNSFSIVESDQFIPFLRVRYEE